MTTKSILLIAFHYPPYQSSSGVLRTLAFSRDLIDLNWDVSVITANVLGGQPHNLANEQLVPPKCKVIRALALDAARHLSLFGKYPGFLDVPDRFSSWILSACLAGLTHIKKRRPDYLLTTYPIASAHIVGLLLSKITGTKWIADFRDPMLLHGHPDTKSRTKAHQWIERKTMENCTVALFTNATAAEKYKSDYPSVERFRFRVVENGYDELIFARAKHATDARIERTASAEIRLLHSGSLYPDHRDPEPFFSALSKMSKEKLLEGNKFKVVLRASGYTERYHSLINRCYPSLRNIVSLESSIDYVASVREILDCDGLLLFQGSNCNAQVPAKLYEYARAQKPILAFTDRAGATSEVLHRLGVTEGADINSEKQITTLINRFIHRRSIGDFTGFVSTVDTAILSRANRSKELDSILRENVP